ncbi:MAG: leucine--tRNA ligase [Candidatus Micrarchaeaceae archaeon]
MIDFNFVETKWQHEWDNAKIFEPEINQKKPFMVTAAIPYPNGPQHIGHLRTYGTADALARYKRMKGFNVLYPMGFHLTGIPLLAQANKIKENNRGIISDLKSFGITDDEIQKMSDPLYMGTYFSNEIESGMKLAGFSIDWRRKFTTVDTKFSKFIEWQFGILKEKNCLVQGKHPIGWCKKENNAVGMHDTKGDVEPEIEQESGLIFDVVGENYGLICATYRPETIYGVTNIFVKPDANYFVCKANNTYNIIVSEKTYETLSFQIKLEKISEINGKDLINKKCINPLSKIELPILPGDFIKEELGTGVVMSVPAHAPFDYVALKKLFISGYLKEEIKPIKVVTVQGINSEVPSLYYLTKVNADVNSSEEKIEEATKLEYKEEAHTGVMNFPGYENMSELETREKIKKVLEVDKKYLPVYILANKTKVFCRCGTEIVVKVIDNQWFINYGNSDWKDLAKEALSTLNIVPTKSKNSFLAAIDWINLRAVARAQGLGTKFPLDKNYIIESLSDSTIYMAYYTIDTIIKNIEDEKLTSDFFDFVFKGKGDIESVSKNTGIDYEIIKKSRDSFTYWYSETSRHSGLDLIFNHLTMYIFNHALIFDKLYWPKHIIVNGLVMMNGEKMSKSLGNTLAVKDAIKKYSSDIIRLVEIGNSDLFNDSDFVVETANSVREKLEFFFDCCVKLNEMPSNKLEQIDYWLYSKLNNKKIIITNAMEKLELRDIITNMIFNTSIELKRYLNRGGNNSIVIKDYLSEVSLMLQPIAPHISEELWHTLGNTTFSSTEKWPEINKELIDLENETKEEEIDSLVDDIKQAFDLTKNKIQNISSCNIIIAAQWKRDALNLLIETKKMDATIEKLGENINKEKVAKYLSQIFKRVNELKKCEVKETDEYESLISAKDYISKIINLPIKIQKEEESTSKRAERAAPLKPSIEII